VSALLFDTILVSFTGDPTVVHHSSVKNRKKMQKQTPRALNQKKLRMLHLLQTDFF